MRQKQQKSAYLLDILVGNSANTWSVYFLYLWTIGQKSFLSDFEKMAYYLNYRPECPVGAHFLLFLPYN